MSEFWWKVAGISACLSIATGAFGSHGLKKKVNNDLNKLDIWKVGSTYHIYHSIGLFLVPFAKASSRNLIGSLFLSGIVLFSGSMYTIAISNKKLGMIPPIGGLLFMAGWVTLGMNLDTTLLR